MICTLGVEGRKLMGFPIIVHILGSLVKSNHFKIEIHQFFIVSSNQFKKHI